MKKHPVIRFFTQDRKIVLKKRNHLKRFIVRIFNENQKHVVSLNYVFCSDSYLLSINQKYLSHDYFTDIITFDLSETGNETIAEVYISIDRVRDNALNEGCWIKEELHRVIFHGALHLCGFEDKKHSQQKRMRELEDYYLSLYFKR